MPSFNQCLCSIIVTYTFLLLNQINAICHVTLSKHCVLECHVECPIGVPTSLLRVSGQGTKVADFGIILMGLQVGH